MGNPAGGRQIARGDSDTEHAWFVDAISFAAATAAQCFADPGFDRSIASHGASRPTWDAAAGSRSCDARHRRCRTRGCVVTAIESRARRDRCRSRAPHPSADNAYAKRGRFGFRTCLLFREADPSRVWRRRSPAHVFGDDARAGDPKSRPKKTKTERPRLAYGAVSMWAGAPSLRREQRARLSTW